MKSILYPARAMTRLADLFGRAQTITIVVLVLLAALLALAAVFFLHLAAPNHLTIAGGPPGSVFERNAKQYQDILAKSGVKVLIVPSEGAVDNLHKLADPHTAVDIGFVLGGETGNADIRHLASLGSVSYQPLLIFYRGTPKKLLSEFKGERLDIGPVGSGTHALALTLLGTNGIGADTATQLVQNPPGDLLAAMMENRVDAVFVMGDSTSSELLRRLLRAPDIHLFNVSQAEGYTRRYNFLNKLVLPKGALDFGADIPPEDVTLVGPTVEILARDSLHPALSDLILEAAREVHGGAGLFKRRGEFPAPEEHEFRISEDANRYYLTGKSFLYRTFPFGIASVIARLAAFVVPFALLLVPALKIAPAVYRWRMESRIHRWYRALLDLEQAANQATVDPEKRRILLGHLDQIEDSVSKIIVPAAFGDLFYILRGHIDFVRHRLAAPMPRVPSQNDATS